MTTLVFGGSSQIGFFLLPALVARGGPVLAVSRHPQLALPGVQWITGELPDALPALPQSPSVIISFGPLLALARWLGTAAAGQPTRVIATSSMSAQTKQRSSVAAERAIAQQLRDGEEELARACEWLGCAWTVLRPTLIYGAGRDKSLTPIARRAMRARVFPLPSGRGLRQPVHAQDVAGAVMAALDCPASAGRVLELGGGERLTAREMFERVRHSLPVGTLPVPIPHWASRLAQHLVPRLRGPLTRLDADLIADNRELEALLGLRPRPFRPEPHCWGPRS